MKKRIVQNIWLFTLLLITLARAGEQSWIQESIDLTINTKFSAAEALLNDRIASGDSTIGVWFYYASVLNSKMAHFESYNDSSDFLEILNKVENKAQRHLSKASLPEAEKALFLFYRGSALGYRAFYEGKREQWFSALSDGLKSIDDLQNAVQLDSTLYDAWLGIGVYKYWRSTKLKFLLWTPFVDDLREEGIEDIKKAIRQSKHSAYMAMHQLIYILLDYGRYDEALFYAQKVIDAYPQSPFMWWAYAHTYYKMRANKKALEAYDILLSLVEADPGANPSHRITCHLRKAEIYKRMGQYNNCAIECRLGLNMKFKDFLTVTGKKNFVKLKQLLQECIRK